MDAHPGFKAVAAKIGRQPGIRKPGAVLASRTREASEEAREHNPNLRKVKGKKKGKSKYRRMASMI